MPSVPSGTSESSRRTTRATNCTMRFRWPETAPLSHVIVPTITSRPVPVRKTAPATANFPPDPCVTYFDSFDQAVLHELRKALNASQSQSPEMTRLLCLVVFRGFESGKNGRRSDDRGPQV